MWEVLPPANVSQFHNWQQRVSSASVQSSPLYMQALAEPGGCSLALRRPLPPVTPDASHQSKLLHLFLIGQQATSPTSHCLSLVNLFAWLTELCKALTLPGLFQRAQMERYTGWGTGEGAWRSVSSPSMPPSRNLWVFSSLAGLFTQTFGVFLGMPLFCYNC